MVKEDGMSGGGLFAAGFRPHEKLRAPLLSLPRGINKKCAIFYRFPERILWHIYLFDEKNIRLNEVCRFTNLSIRQFDGISSHLLTLFHKSVSIPPYLWARKYSNLRTLRLFRTLNPQLASVRSFLDSLPEICPKLQFFELRANSDEVAQTENAKGVLAPTSQKRGYGKPAPLRSRWKKERAREIPRFVLSF